MDDLRDGERQFLQRRKKRNMQLTHSMDVRSMAELSKFAGTNFMVRHLNPPRNLGPQGPCPRLK